ncbi:MAG TPA: hypothetical protein DGT21_10015, partial [Armatimonadetes bacterium]|nr:hypothetical protein [Armatimonadota bacterium]
MERVCLLVVTGVALLVSATAGSAQPVKTGKQQEALWLHRVIPLPKQIAIPAHVTLPAAEVGLRLRSGAGDAERQAAAELKALFDAQTGAALSGDGFQIHIGVADAQGRMGAAVVPEVRQLVGLPNSEQAYVIVPVGERKLILAGLDERGVYYAARTLQDLLQGAFADGRVTIPLATVVDWPDMAERGEWGGSAAGDIEWMAARKLNLVELHAGMKVNAEGRGVATIDQGKITAGRLRALKVVPIIMHLDYLHGTGLYERYPGVVGVGNAARTGAGGDPVALCFSQPKSTEMLADWMRSLAAYEGVTDIMVWLSEYHGRCECEACDAALQQGVTQHALEVQAVGKALDILREDYPRLNARVLLTQGTYPDNDKVLAATPDNVQVSYYCGGGRERSTY